MSSWSLYKVKWCNLWTNRKLNGCKSNMVFWWPGGLSLFAKNFIFAHYNRNSSWWCAGNVCSCFCIATIRTHFDDGNYHHQVILYFILIQCCAHSGVHEMYLHYSKIVLCIYIGIFIYKQLKLLYGNIISITLLYTASVAF